MNQVDTFWVADFTCPFSYVTEAGLCQWEAKHGGTLRRAAFELFPSGTEPAPPVDTSALPAAFAALCEQARLTIRTPTLRPRTAKAHEASRFARTVEREGSMRAAIYRAYFVEDRDLSRIDVLVECAEEAGVDPTDLRIALDIDRFTAHVRAENARLREIGITGTPWILPGADSGIAALGGARSIEELEAYLAPLAAKRRDTSNERD